MTIYPYIESTTVLSDNITYIYIYISIIIYIDIGYIIIIIDVYIVFSVIHNYVDINFTKSLANYIAILWLSISIDIATSK